MAEIRHGVVATGIFVALWTTVAGAQGPGLEVYDVAAAAATRLGAMVNVEELSFVWAGSALVSRSCHAFSPWDCYRGPIELWPLAEAPGLSARAALVMGCAWVSANQEKSPSDTPAPVAGVATPVGLPRVAVAGGLP